MLNVWGKTYLNFDVIHYTMEVCGRIQTTYTDRKLQKLHQGFI